MKYFWKTLKQTYKAWQKDKASVWAASISYTCVFSIGPLLLLIVSILGFFLSSKVIIKELSFYVSQKAGPQVAVLLTNLIANQNHNSANIIFAIFGTFALIASALGIFLQLENAFIYMWSIQISKNGIIEIITRYLFGLLMLVIGGFFLLLLLISNSMIKVISSYMHRLRFADVIVEIITIIISILILEVMFMVFFKFFSHGEISWKHSWYGGLFTAVLFTFGQFVVGIIVGLNGTKSIYGAAGSLVILLLWIYCNAQIFFFGAEFTKVLVKQKDPLENERRNLPYTFQLIASTLAGVYATIKIYQDRNKFAKL